MDRANRLAERGQQAAALSLYDSVATNAAAPNWLRIDANLDQAKILQDLSRAADAAPKLIRSLSLGAADTLVQLHGWPLEDVTSLLDAALIAAPDNAEVLLTRATVASVAKQPELARQFLQRSLAAQSSPIAHQSLAFVAVPKDVIAGKPRSAEVTALFAAAERAYGAHDFTALGQIAEHLLARDPDDGLAHHLLAVALAGPEQAALNLREDLATPERRQQICAAFATECAQAQVGNRAGRPEDLVPDWPRLTLEQRATIARSALTVGRWLPRLIEKHATLATAGVATSLASVDPHGSPLARNEYGDSEYGSRTWRRGYFAAVGIENVDAWPRGHGGQLDAAWAQLVYQLMQETEPRDDEGRAMVALRADFAQVVSRTHGGGGDFPTFSSAQDPAALFRVMFQMTQKGLNNTNAPLRYFRDCFVAGSLRLPKDWPLTSDGSMPALPPDAPPPAANGAPPDTDVRSEVDRAFLEQTTDKQSADDRLQVAEALIDDSTFSPKDRGRFALRIAAVAPSAKLEVLFWKRAAELDPDVAKYEFRLEPAAHRTALLRLAQREFPGSDAVATLAVADAAEKDAKNHATTFLRDTIRAFPCDASARAELVAMVLPNFSSPLRPQIERWLADANAAYVQGDFTEVRRLAQHVLAVDENETMAHNLYAAALSREQKSAPRWELANSDQQQALISQLEKACGGNVSALFPDWSQLTQLQRASVARSALCFGKSLRQLIASGGKLHVVAPGTSLVRASESIETRRIRGSFHYGVRGLNVENQAFVGVEGIDAVASGDADTDLSDDIRHELAHCLHDLWMKQAQDDPKIKARVVAIKRLYSEAAARRNGQSIDDEEARANEYEYFAWGCTGDTKGNPKLDKFLQKLLAEISDAPSQ